MGSFSWRIWEGVEDCLLSYEAHLLEYFLHATVCMDRFVKCFELLLAERFGHRFTPDLSSPLVIRGGPWCIRVRLGCKDVPLCQQRQVVELFLQTTVLLGMFAERAILLHKVST